jgi:hypothetical protein
VTGSVMARSKGNRIKNAQDKNVPENGGKDGVDGPSLPKSGTCAANAWAGPIRRPKRPWRSFGRSTRAMRESQPRSREPKIRRRRLISAFAGQGGSLQQNRPLQTIGFRAKALNCRRIVGVGDPGPFAPTTWWWAQSLQTGLRPV